MDYYVYQLIDPRDEEPFYIGKGKGSRVRAHERDAASGVQGGKCDRIREIWAAGLEVRRKIVSRHSEEARAYEAEAALIAQVGLGRLTNLVPGGGGVVERVKRPGKFKLATLSKATNRELVQRLFRFLRSGCAISMYGRDFTDVFRGVARTMIRDIGAKGIRGLLADV